MSAATIWNLRQTRSHETMPRAAITARNASGHVVGATKTIATAIGTRQGAWTAHVVVTTMGDRMIPAAIDATILAITDATAGMTLAATGATAGMTLADTDAIAEKIQVATGATAEKGVETAATTAVTEEKVAATETTAVDAMTGDPAGMAANPNPAPDVTVTARRIGQRIAVTGVRIAL